jgi:hypothetical protein
MEIEKTSGFKIPTIPLEKVTKYRKADKENASTSVTLNPDKTFEIVDKRTESTNMLFFSINKTDITTTCRGTFEAKVTNGTANYERKEGETDAKSIAFPLSGKVTFNIDGYEWTCETESSLFVFNV